MSDLPEFLKTHAEVVKRARTGAQDGWVSGLKEAVVRCVGFGNGVKAASHLYSLEALVPGSVDGPVTADGRTAIQLALEIRHKVNPFLFEDLLSLGIDPPPALCWSGAGMGRIARSRPLPPKEKPQ